MSDIKQAIQIETMVEIDWVELGRAYAHVTSSHQADFLMGFYEDILDLQLAFIGGARIFDGSRAEVAEVLESLAAFIRVGDRK